MRNDKVVVNRRGGFTIVELLTVMAVIAILIGLLVPALNLVKDYAKEIQQKAQFHAIGVGVELFKSEFGMYPPSNDNLDASGIGANHPYDPTPYGGAHKLAEALVGWDLLGFHPRSDFRSDGMNDYDNDGTPDLIYDPIDGIDTGSDPEASGAENIENREGPFIELENANAFRMADIYGSNTGDFEVDNPVGGNFVLCDVFSKKRVSGRKTGMPVLYYRARTQYTYQDYTTLITPDEIADDIYYYPDNQNLLDLGSAEDATVDHPLADGAAVNNWEDFEDMILNKQVVDIKRPYRAGSYILISAGPDGLYGNADDICNFTKEEQ
jgi:prepilin-type N-terminal cleavage/methylation domain-containing protein